MKVSFLLHEAQRLHSTCYFSFAAHISLVSIVSPFVSSAMRIAWNTSSPILIDRIPFDLCTVVHCTRMKCFLLTFQLDARDVCDVSMHWTSKLWRPWRKRNYQMFVLKMKIKDRYALLVAVCNMQCIPAFCCIPFQFTFEWRKGEP